MTTTDAARQRNEFMARLDVAMQSVPHGIASEIRGGIAEELEGLDAEGTAARIAQLGDPVVIAREAHVGAQDARTPPGFVAAEPRAAVTATKGFAIAAALVLSFGGILVPVIGWIVGAVMVCASSLWKTWEKVVAIVVPLGLAATVIVFGLGAWHAEAPELTVTETRAGNGVAAPMVSDPLVPAAYDVVWMGVFGLGVVLIPASGLWLLWRLRGR